MPFPAACLPRLVLAAAAPALAATGAAAAPCDAPFVAEGVSVEIRRDAVTATDFPGPTVCRAPLPFGADPSLVEVNAAALFGEQDWSLVGVRDFDAGTVEGAGFEILGDGMGGSYAILPDHYFSYDEAFLLMTTRGGLTPTAIAYLLPPLNFEGEYAAPWLKTAASDGSVSTVGIGRIALYMAGAVRPGAEVPLPAALPLSLLGLGALAAVAGRRGARRGRGRDSGLDAPEGAG